MLVQGDWQALIVTNRVARSPLVPVRRDCNAVLCATVGSGAAAVHSVHLVGGVHVSKLKSRVMMQLWGLPHHWTSSEVEEVAKDGLELAPTAWCVDSLNSSDRCSLSLHLVLRKGKERCLMELAREEDSNPLTVEEMVNNTNSILLRTHRDSDNVAVFGMLARRCLSPCQVAPAGRAAAVGRAVLAAFLPVALLVVAVAVDPVAAGCVSVAGLRAGAKEWRSMTQKRITQDSTDTYEAKITPQKHRYIQGRIHWVAAHREAQLADAQMALVAETESAIHNETDDSAGIQWQRKKKKGEYDSNS